MPKPRVYVSHPLDAFKTPTAAALLAAIAEAIPGGKVVDAADLYPSRKAWLRRYRREIGRSSAFVFFPYRSTIGFGTFRELACAEDLGVPTYLFHGGKLWNTWTLSILHHRHQWKRFARVAPRGHPLDPAEVVLGGPRGGRLLPTGPLGRVIENRIVEYLLVLSEGRLVVYRPEADFEGTDLHVTLLHRKPVLKLQVKGRTDPGTARFLRFGVRPETIPPDDPKQLLFCWYDLKNAELRRWVWLVDSDTYRGDARTAHNQYKADLSTLADARDRWVDYRHNTKDIAWIVEQLLSGSPMPGAPGKEAVSRRLPPPSRRGIHRSRGP